MRIKRVIKRMSKYLPDSVYLRLKYLIFLKKPLNLKKPKTYTEKLQWLKLYNRKPEYTQMVDKYEMRKFIAEKIGEEYLIPLLGVWDSAEDIDFDALPEQFVLKCNHNSGTGMCICKDKNSLDIEKVRKDLERGLREKYFYTGREWPYKNVKPRIIAEKFMVDNNSENQNGETCLVDYKFFCFNGEPKIMYCSRDLAANPGTDFFDMDYNRLEMRMKDPNSNNPPEKPVCFEEMKKLAKILSAGIPHIRVDFYQIDGKVYMGELTFFHNSGFTKIHPEKWNRILGDWIVL